MDKVAPECLTHNSYTVGWICALDVELAASMAMLDYELPKLSQVQGDTNTYVLGRIGQHNIVLTCLPVGTTGTNAAANTATNMRRSFHNIHFCMMVGIGGGAPSAPSDNPCGDIRLGDVVVSCPSANSGGVLQYDFGKTMSEGKFIQTGVLDKTSIVLSNSVSTLRARHRIEESCIFEYIDGILESNRKIQKEFSHPGLEHDQLFRADYEHPNGEPTCHSCDIEALVLRKPRENTNPIIHYGLIGSANQVMRHGATRDKLRDEKNIFCFEMEAAGLMNILPCLIIRGICDYADSHKNKRWQPYAAVTAAACAKEVLLATPTSEVPVKEFFNAEAIYNMLQTTLHELDWNELLTLLPVRGYTHPESLITSRNYNDSKYHWVLRNIDFNQWRSKEDPRVLYLTGQSSKGNLNKLLSYTIGKEKAAGYSVLSVLCSTLGCMPNVTTFLYIFLLELMHSYRETERTPIIRSFMGKLLENHMVKGIMNWKEEKLDKSVFLKYMYTVLGGVAPKDLLSWLKEAINFESQGPLLVLIDGLDLIEASNGIVGCVLSLIEHLQRRESKTKILLASSTIPKSISFCQNFLHIEYNKERKECLRSLEFDNTRYDKISNEHEGSFEWIWNHNEYKSWSASNTSRLFYIQGKPGSGKSTLMKYFNRNLLLKESSAQQAIVARFFYSFRDGELQRSHYSMLLSILYEILHQDEGFFYHQCQAEYRAHQREDLPFKWDYGSLKKLLKSLQNYRTNNQYYLAIDAIDESEPNDRREILGLLFDLCSKMKHSVVKIFMASRPVAQLESRRDQFHNFIKLDAETRADIHKYAHSRLHDLHSTDLLTQATAHILENAQGVFLWVKLISEQLIEAYEEGYSEKELFRLLKQLPTELEDLYKLMIEKMEHNNASLLYGAKMFQFILFAKRPLTVDEVLHALGILNSADSNSKFIPSDALFEKHIPASDRIILSGGGNFLELREHNGQNIVQIMHQTVREFFLDPDGPVANSRFSVSEARGHINMAISCMRYLSMCAANTSLAGELPELNSWDSVQYKDYCQYLNRRPLASYALSYTRSHIAICGQDANVHYVVSQFIEQSANTDPSTFLLENWASLELHQSSLSNNNAEDATAMNFRCEVLRAASIYGFDIAAEIVLLAETDMENQDEDGRTPLFLAASNGHERMVKLLLDIQADINTANNNGQTCLSCAAENGHRDIVKLLVEKGASVHESDKLDRTPLLLAAENGHLETIKFLLEERADIHRFDDFHQTPLLMAAKNGHLDSVDFLARNGKEIDQGNKLHQTPLLMAVMNKHPNTAQFLIRIGANIHESDDFHQTPLIMAAENGLLDTVQLLVEEGAKIHQSDKLNRTSLFAAAENGHLDIVQFLDEKGANIHCPNNFHQTPLLIASKNGHLDIVKLLIDRGSDIYTSEESGLTCFLWAVKNGHRDIVELLAEKGKNIHEKSYLGQTPLLLAIEHDQLSVVELLVELGANINQSDYYCQTPLSKAVEHNHLSIVQFLVEKGANIECRDFFGQTPLSLAVEHNYLSIVQFLVARGACVDDRDDCGQTPLSRALINGNLDIINILKERGAIKRKRKRSPSPNSVL